MITENEFRSLAAAGYNKVTLVQPCLADLDTPLGIYLKLADRPGSFLLESVEGGERFARFSFIGLPAETKITARVSDGAAEVRLWRGDEVVERVERADPLSYVEDYLRRFRCYTPRGLPPFTGGLVGYFGYDTVRVIEPGRLGRGKPDDLGIPDITLLQCDELVAYDNLRGRLYLILNVDPSSPDAYLRARQRLRRLREELSRAPQPPYAGSGVSHPEERPFAREDFLAAVRRAKEYIAAGDLMQVQIGQRVQRQFSASPVTLYRALRAANPSPYMYLYNFGDLQVIGASPEILARLDRRDGRRVAVIRPIAGTRPRGGTSEEDERLAAELSADPKERAEHLMLIDLARNDIGRVAKIGTVTVPEQFVIERYSRVQHLVSHVEGELRDELGPVDLLRASFPAGTLTGAPKIRAMELIDELEPARRGVYGGAVGYLSWHGDMDLAITIRTALIKDRVLYAQAAAGIVADSTPESEWRETELKARAVLRAAEEAELGLEES